MSENTTLSIESLKIPKVLVAAAIAALGGVMYAGDGFTIEFSTCDTEEAEPVEEEAPEPEPEPEEETE